MAPKLYLLTRIIAFLCLGVLSPSLEAKAIFEGRFEGGQWLENFNRFYTEPWTEGIERATVVKDPVTKKSVLRVSYPAKKFGNDLTGTQWKTYLDKNYEHLTLTYRVKFEKGFDFVQGGKLPGLVGGHEPGHKDSVVSGGYKPNGRDGWSARIMWRRSGHVVQYLYHPDQPGKYGQDLPWVVNGKPAVFTPGKWHSVKTEIQLNTPGKKDGLLRSWFDGSLALERRDLRFRDLGSIGIDCLYFSTFFGGDDESWATSKDEYVFFDGFRIDA